MNESERHDPPSLLERMRLSTRIYFSIGALLVLFLLAISIACFGLLNLKTNVARFAGADRFATLIDRIDRDIVELQRDVLIFSFTGNPAAPERVAELGDRLRAEITEAQSLVESNEKTAYRLNEMQTRLESYLERFPEVVAERTTRREFVEQRLRNLEEMTRRAFDELRQTINDKNREESAVASVSPVPVSPVPVSPVPESPVPESPVPESPVPESPVPESPVTEDSPATGSPPAADLADIEQETEAVIVVERAMGQVALAQINSLRFFNDPDVANVRATTALLTEASDSLKRFSNDEDPQLAADANALIKLLQEYEADFVRAVQATRGYLSLVNVVMAGEAAEFLYQSKQIQERTEAETKQISSDTLSIANRSNIGVALFALFAILASLVVTTMAVRGIVNPISAMTNTFSKLMKGQNEASIPGLKRRDEIGEMARAADTFRNRNQQTEELLQQAQELADELDSKADELARSNADLNSFAYVASHDLRSPLRAIDNIATWLEEDLGESIPDESQSLLVELRRRVSRMEQLLSELLEYSRVGREEIRLTETDLRELLEETARLVDLPSNAEVVIEDPTPTIVADRGSLTRVILNLFSNAIKYRSEEPLRIRCRCNVEGEKVHISVTDNGIGIAPKFHDRIFVMFKRLHTQSQIEGSGMGLALVQKLIEQSGGEIGLESQEGQGACFWFTWPTGPVQKRATASSAAEQT